MFHFKIHGPRYAVLTQTVWFEVTEFMLPPPYGPDDLTIQWYKNNIPINLLPEENKFRLDLYDVGYPAEGTYSARATLPDGTTALSNSIFLEIGAEYKQCSVNITSRKQVKAAIGETVSFAPVCVAYPDYAHRDCTWYHNGVALGPDEYIDVTVDSPEKYGEYDLHTNVWAHGGWEPISVDTLLEIIPREDSTVVCGPRQIHDLNPGRDSAYIWAGWWVIDEIVEANIEGFDWQADPFNNRFKYPCEISNIASGLQTYPEIEVQESRNGYILSRRDLIW